MVALSIEDLLRKMRQCSGELAPLAQLVGCLAIWTSSALFTIATEYFTSQGRRTGCPRGNSCPQCLTTFAKVVRTASFTSFTALTASPLLRESYSARSSALTATPAGFNAVAADSVRAKIAGSVSDLTRTSVRPLQVTLFFEFTNRTPTCTLRWHNGCRFNDHGHTQQPEQHCSNLYFVIQGFATVTFVRGDLAFPGGNPLGCVTLE